MECRQGARSRGTRTGHLLGGIGEAPRNWHSFHALNFGYRTLQKKTLRLGSRSHFSTLDSRSLIMFNPLVLCCKSKKISLNNRKKHVDYRRFTKELQVGSEFEVEQSDRSLFRCFHGSWMFVSVDVCFHEWI